MLIVYILFLILCIGLLQYSRKQQNYVLIISCVFLVIGIGFRDMRWPDTDAYWLGFLQYTPTIFDYTWGMNPRLYDEQGLFLISVLSKTLINNYQFYFLVVGGLTMFLLYKNLKEYSIFPLLGLCAYLARFFMARNLIQIRSGLAYLIILWGLKYIHEKKMWHYILLVWVASWFHHSAWIALPLYFISNWVHISKTVIISGLGVAFIIGAFFQGPLSAFVTDKASDLEITTYVTNEYKSKVGLGNPMIYFQCFLLLSYTFLEKKLKPITKYYKVIRDGYFYSTLILISFCSFTALSGRTSTMFATLEYCIIPSVIFLFHRRNRAIAYFILMIALSVIMYLNMPEWARFSL